MSDQRKVSKAKRKLTFGESSATPCSVVLSKIHLAQSTPLPVSENQRASKRKLERSQKFESDIESTSEVESVLDEEQFQDLSSPRHSPIGSDNETTIKKENSESHIEKIVENLNKTDFFKTATDFAADFTITEEKTNKMATISSTQMVDIIPRCTSADDVEQFVSIVDKLNKQVKADDTALFLAIVSAKIQKKAFDAIKGITIDKWEDLKEALTKGLEQKIDRATATNRLMHIKQNTKESLKDYTTRVKDALAVLNRATIREISNEATCKCMLEQNDAIAKNTFESGIKDDKLKTIVVASKEKTFNDSHNCAVNQQQTNFPTDEKNITCFYCGKPNHTANECFKKQSENRSKSVSPGANNNQYSNFNRNNSNRNTYGNSYNSSFSNQNRNSPNNSQNRNSFGGSYNNNSFGQNRNSFGNSYNSSSSNQNNSQAGNRTSNYNNNNRNTGYNNNNSNNNANNNNGRSNWNRNTASNTNTSNGNRNSESNTNVRMLRDSPNTVWDLSHTQLEAVREEEDWDQILPFPTTTEDQGN